MDRTFVGIDPDVDGSGVAMLTTTNDAGSYKRKAKEIVINNYRLPDLIRFFGILAASDLATQTMIIVEAGWKNHSNWHIPTKAGVRMAAEIGRRTGRNHQIAMDIADIARSYGLTVIERPPLVKTWKGKDGKITHEELAYFTGLTEKRSNQEQRDALMLAWNEAGLPIRIKI